MVQELGTVVVGGFVVDFFAVAAAGDELGAFELFEMVTHCRAAHVDHCGNIDDALLTVAEQPENADAVAITKLLENVGDDLKVVDARHVGEQVVRKLTVVVRQIVV